MRPSSVRDRILKEHDEIREWLFELERDCEALDSEGHPALKKTLDRARAFYDHLHTHIELEDSILVPAMREADAWGDLRAEQLLKHHREQRLELRELGQMALERVEPAALATRLRKLIADVRADMAHEEKGVLSPNLLRDDLVGINVEGG